ncbi:polysaccharide biosynthesis C-terminal domain-containing protein [uncultured Winogradskyella sp.]|uniref:oligosaccharide flippase family protein n=1 Tax=uncultured Winogradskyella sp. TaxID=395353 RepID=UPI0026221637|nr:polysaccharide biosynthesis C-terminal domain-containing protein [uncultured Winogradskyella sp.]
MKTQLKYSASNFIRLLETLVLNIGLARVILDVSEFGKLQQFFVILTFAVTVASAFPTTLNYYISKYNTFLEKNALYKRFFFSMIFFSMLAAFLFFVLKDKLALWFENDFFPIYIVYFVFIILFKITNTFFSNFFLFSDKLNYLNVTSFLFLISYLAGFFYFGTHEFTITEILQFFLIYEVVKFLVYSIPFAKSFKEFNFKTDVNLKNEELKFVLPTIFLVLAGILNMQIDKYMISAIETPEVFAFYQVGAFNIPFIAVITTSLFTVITPKITELLRDNHITKTLKLTKTTTKQISVLLLPIIVFCFLFSTEIIILLFGSRFEESGSIFKIYTLRFLISVFPFSIFMGIIGLKNLAPIHVVASAVVNVICNLILIPIYGNIGAVIATLIASYTTVIIPILFINRRLSTNLFSYFPIIQILKVIIVSTLVALPFYFIAKDLFIADEKKYYIVPLSIFYYLIILIILERKFFKNLVNKFK